MIAPTRHVLERAVRNYVGAGSGLNPDTLVIPGQSKGPAPKEAYATVVLIDETADGTEWTRHVRAGTAEAPTVDATVSESVTVSWSVQFFRRGARDLARTFRVWAQSPLGIAEAARRGLTFYRTSGVRELDTVVSEAWEERAGLDLYLGYVATLVQDVGLVDSFDVTVSPDEGEPFTARLDETPPCNS